MAKAIFVLRSENINKLYYEKEDFLEDIKNAKNPCVRTFCQNDKDLAEDFLTSKKSLEEIKILCAGRLSKKEKAKKREQDMLAFREHKYVPRLYYNGNNICFIDVEASKEKAISIGLIIYSLKENKSLEEYYSLLKPFNFKGMDNHSKNLTKLTNEDIFFARDFNLVYDEISNILKKYEIINEDIFSWGHSDKYYLKNSLSKDFSYGWFNGIRNIQTIISEISYGYYKNPTWSLCDMGKILKITNKETSHNALEDAKDLMNIFKAWKNVNINNIDIDYILSIKNKREKRVS